MMPVCKSAKKSVAKKMLSSKNVSVFGLGYVGSVTAGCLADLGCRVVGVEVNPLKVDWINSGRPPVLEAQLTELVEKSVQDDRLTATTSVAEAIAQTDISLICVGTPSKPNGDLDLQYVCRVAEQIGDALAQKNEYHTVVLRSTVLPGTTWNVVRPILEQCSGKQAGKEFGLCFNPEFLREGSAVADFYQPPFTVLGAQNPIDIEKVRELYSWLEAELIVTDLRTAEAVKYINNCFHALKVAFANEVGRLCHALKIDSHQIMEIFCKDTKQNLSSYYFKPGYAFGGSCLPKDLRAMLYQAKKLDVPLEVFQAALSSNRTQIEIGVEMVMRAGNKKVGLLGLSFKAGTDDLRESPLVTLVETLHGRGYKVKIFDEHVCLSRLIGANRAYIEHQLPHIGAMLCESMDEVVQQSETIVIGNAHQAFRDLLPRIPSSKTVIDLVRINNELHPVPCNYHGIGW
jgi:GDP-mannose 6-dehydrogenase